MKKLPPTAAALVMLLCAVSVARTRADAAQVVGQPLPIVRVPQGKFRPLFAADGGKNGLVVVPAFWLMTRPVTNAEFLAFVTERAAYRRDRIARVFADAQYLVHWQSASELGPAARAQQPVTNVSWFAAKAFCEAHGLRLPNEVEWELAASASRTQRDARKDPEFARKQLDWYSKPAGELPDVPYGPANLYGVHDLHAVIWEWVLDFNNARVVEDSRDRGDSAKDRYCGGAALDASDATDYATFMRLAMRSALQAAYTSSTLGFRCARDAARRGGDKS